jgi:hypothetical protein
MRNMAYGMMRLSRILLYLCCIVSSVAAWRWYNQSNAVVEVLPKKPTVSITVFIHGSIGVELHIPHMQAITNNQLADNSWCVGVVSRLRNDPICANEQALAHLGLALIPKEKLSAVVQDTLTAEEAALGKYYIIAAYDAAAKGVGLRDDHTYYATFGWSGLLSQQHRKQAGLALYNELIAFRSWCRATHGVDPCIRLITHSHGGTVALLLSEAEELKKQGLHIHLLFMLGVPFHKEIGHCLMSPLFGTIISGYSYGDKIQPRDTFSSTYGCSYRRMKDIITLEDFKKQYPHLLRCDVLLIARDELHRIDHSNMWHLARSVRILPWLDPLPFVVVCPLIITLIERNRTHHDLVACMYGKKHECSMVLKACDTQGNHHHLDATPNVYEHLIPVVKATCTTWVCKDFSRSTVLNKKQLLSLYYACRVA